MRDGTPYSIARIMEFLPAQGTPTFDRAGRRNEPITRVRLAWYYRPSDVSDRTVADSRLLLAAIYSEVCELSQLRARCFVHHRDRISDLAGWKKRPDRFYFTRLFDPWLRKEFEVIPATTVRNGGWRIRTEYWVLTRGRRGRIRRTHIPRSRRLWLYSVRDC